MYHLPKPKASYNKQFVEKFAKENEDLAKCTKHWSNNEETSKKDKNGMYATGSLSSPYFFPLQCCVDYLGDQTSTIFHQIGYLYWMQLPMPP